MTKFCVWVDVQDLITDPTFGDDRLKGLGLARGRISRFPIDLRRRPYNTLALPCECVIGSGVVCMETKGCNYSSGVSKSDKPFGE